MAALFLWISVLALLALWSLTVWAGHAAAVWAVSNAGALSGTAADIAAIRLPPGWSSGCRARFWSGCRACWPIWRR